MKFTGRQVTVMVVAVCAAAILTPAAVYAATGTLVNITDPVTSSQKARVIGGKLAVGDGSGAMTVDGSVYAKEPLSTWAGTKFFVPNDGQTTSRLVFKSLAPLAGLSLGTLTISHESGTGPTSVRLRSIQPSTAGNCLVGGTVKQEIASFALAEGDTQVINWAPGFRVKKQSVATCVFAFVFGGSGSHTVSMTATGSLY
jgi:hypothetical protein